MVYRRIASYKTQTAFQERLEEVGCTWQADETVLSAADGSPLASPIDWDGMTIGNRWCIHPMEGWDGTSEGDPTEHTLRRWKNFGLSGAKLIWGGEAFAVQRDGRANPNQLYFQPGKEQGLRDLLTTLQTAHQESFGESAIDDLVVGLQLTHSGRFSRPEDKARLQPRIAYHHPVLDRRCGIAAEDDSVLWTDGELRQLIDNYIQAAKLAEKIGFQFVDVKHCHGYLGHEFLSAYDRPGDFGGDLEGRSRFMREIVEGIQAECPNLKIGVRLSVFDSWPFKPGDESEAGYRLGVGVPDSLESFTEYPVFGAKRDDPTVMDLSEPIELIRLMKERYNISMWNLSAASPYYNPHFQRPALFPPSDGYAPPEDPLAGCVRQVDAVAEVKKAIPEALIVGSGYTYFQDYLPHVAQKVVRDNMVDFVGLGRMVLSYWDLPAKVMDGTFSEATKRICRTFSDCTSAPRNGIISGCYPLDPFYKGTPEHAELKEFKKAMG